MLRPSSEALRPAWSEFLTNLIQDLAPLGYFVRLGEDGAFVVGTTIPFDRGDCPSSDDLRHIAGFEKGGSGSSTVVIMRHAVGAANDDFRWSCV